MKHCFIITSAINTRFGIYTPTDRLLQTIITIRSIKQKIPDAKIVLVEMAGLPLDEQQTKTLVSEVDVLLDFTDEKEVKSLYESTENWDVVKNGTEMLIFGTALQMLDADGEFKGIDRIHKISGRYVINDDFKPELYERPDVKDKIVVSRRRASQFPVEIQEQRFQYMSRLWSWPTSLMDMITTFYSTATTNFFHTVSTGLYIDIEHSLGKYLPQEFIWEVPLVGIEGTIGPNGHAVKD